MKKMVASVLLVISIMLNKQVFATSSSEILTMTAAFVAADATEISSHSEVYNIYKAIDIIYAETLNEDLKQYIIENIDYLYLNTEEEAIAVINKYKKSNLKETEQFIKDNYYDENKPKRDIMIVAIALIITLIITAIILIGLSKAEQG